jgi:hypothetical protein
MKKNIYLLLAGFAAMAMATSCSDNELVGNDASTSNQPKTITINASAAEGSDSRVAYSESGTTIACTWQSTDTLYVATSDSIDSTKTNKTPKSATFVYSKLGSDAHHANIHRNIYHRSCCQRCFVCNRSSKKYYRDEGRRHWYC